MRWHRRGVWVRCAWVGLLLLVLCSGRPAEGQSALQAEVLSELQVLGSRAATVFVGQIVRIERHGSVVEVLFRVERPVQGATGSTVVLREWAGTWVQGESKYRVGQRALAFLHEGSPAGFSSPVHGAEGLVPVEVQGANAPMLLDVRRVAASVVRAAGTPLPAERDSLLQLDDVLAVVYPKQGLLGAPVSGLRLLPAGGRPRATFQPVPRADGAPAVVPVNVARPALPEAAPVGSHHGAR